MYPYNYRAVANGLRTDHPIPDLPFVDDSHIPIEDPHAVEAVGRHKAEGMWGREDPCPEGAWVAFTTDPFRRDLAWCVRWHPLHGRSVILYRDDDASSVHMTLWGPPLLFRAGGYWWDGTTWYRPLQIWDRASEEYVRRPVPAATTVTAADLLASGGADPKRAKALAITDVDTEAPLRGRWLDHLAMWAEHHDNQGWLSDSVITLTAPELTADQLVGVAELAAIAEVAPSTLRAYISRGEGEVPPPQATIGGRSMWSRPVAEEWAERRRLSSDGAAQAVATEHRGASPAPGVADLWRWFSEVFFVDLWQNPSRRKRWALRWRTPAAVQEIATDLGWSAAAGLDRIISISDLAITVRHAVIDELTYGQQLERDISQDRRSPYYGITSPVARTLDWLIRHHPVIAQGTIGEIVGDAEDRLEIPRDVTANSIRTALALDGKLDNDAYDEFLDRVLPPDGHR